MLPFSGKHTYILHPVQLFPRKQHNQQRILWAVHVEHVGYSSVVQQRMSLQVAKPTLRHPDAGSSGLPTSAQTNKPNISFRICAMQLFLSPDAINPTSDIASHSHIHISTPLSTARAVLRPGFQQVAKLHLNRARKPQLFA